MKSSLKFQNALLDCRYYVPENSLHCDGPEDFARKAGQAASVKKKEIKGIDGVSGG